MANGRRKNTDVFGCNINVTIFSNAFTNPFFYRSFSKKINRMFFSFAAKQFPTTATITARSCFHFHSCFSPYNDGNFNFPRKNGCGKVNMYFHMFKFRSKTKVCFSLSGLHRIYFRFLHFIVKRTANQKIIN